MGFSQSHASVQEQRIIDLAGRLGHSQGSCVGELVITADHEGVEGKLRIDIGLFKIRTNHRTIRDGSRSLCGSSLLLMGVLFRYEFHIVLFACKFGDGHKNRRLKLGVQIGNHLLSHGNNNFYDVIVGAVYLQRKEPGLKRNIRKFMFLSDVLENLGPFFFYQIHIYLLSAQNRQFILYSIIYQIQTGIKKRIKFPARNVETMG